MEKYQDSLLTKFNYDANGTPTSVSMVETQVVTKKSLIQLMQFPDEFHRVTVQTAEGNYLTETYNAYDIKETQFYVNYATGVVYFHPSQIAQSFTFTYYGRGVEMISTSRIFHKYNLEGDEIVRTMTEIVDELIDVSTDAVEKELERQKNEQERIERFDAQMETIQQEIFDKDSAFQAQMGQQAQIFDDKIKEVEDKILSDNNLFNQHLEVLDQRFDEQLETWDEEVNGLSNHLTGALDSLESRFKLDLSKPIYHKTVRGVRASVMQQFVKLKDGSCLISQVGASTETEKESFTITRLGQDGSIISTMECLEGGHAWFQAHEQEDDIHLYFTDARERLIHTIYRDNHVLDLRLDAQYEVIPNPVGERCLMAIDFEHDLIMLMSHNEAGVYDRADIFKFSSLLDGSQTTPHLTLTNLLTEGQTMQGIAIQKDKAYFYTGALRGKCALRVIDLGTQVSTDYHYPQLGYTHKNDSLSVVEGEGLFIDGEMVYIGVATGVGTRYNHIYAFAPIEKQAEMLSHALAHAQTFKLIEGTGFVKPIYAKPLRLEELTEPGEYYFSGKEFTFEDVPAEYKGGSGFFVHNSARAGDGTIYQIITRNTASGNCYRLGRQISGTTKIGAPWKALTPEKKTLHSKDTRQLTTFTLTDSISNYDFILVRVWSAGGQWQSFMFDSAVVMAQKGLALQSTNLPDSTSSNNVYFQELVCSIDEAGLVISQDRKSQIHISSAGALTRSEEALIGICEIIGIRGFNTL